MVTKNALLTHSSFDCCTSHNHLSEMECHPDDWLNKLMCLILFSEFHKIRSGNRNGRGIRPRRQVRWQDTRMMPRKRLASRVGAAQNFGPKQHSFRIPDRSAWQRLAVLSPAEKENSFFSCLWDCFHIYLSCTNLLFYSHACLKGRALSIIVVNSIDSACLVVSGETEPLRGLHLLSPTPTCLSLAYHITTTKSKSKQIILREGRAWGSRGRGSDLFAWWGNRWLDDQTNPDHPSRAGRWWLVANQHLRNTVYLRRKGM